MDQHLEPVLSSDLRIMLVEPVARFWGVLRSFNLAICACLKRGEQFFLARAVSGHVPPNQIEKYDLINALRKSREMCQRIEHVLPGKGMCLRSTTKVTNPVLKYEA